MSIRNLDHLFSPQSVAVIGASNRPHSVGATVLDNLLNSGFEGAIYPVNPKHHVLAGREVYASLDHLPGIPDLAVICTPPLTVPDLISQLGKLGTKAAIVLTAGLSAVKDKQGRTMKELMLSAANPYLLRVLGPNCIGLLVPRLKLNASFSHVDALPGKIAFVSQSGAMVTGILDWARSRGIGFSKFISLGEVADVDFGDVLDYLARDPHTESILLYVEAITSPRKFMSAARSAARSKPTMIIKAGRVAEGAKAAASHTGALAGADGVYDAAIRRAGILRVYSTEELFDAVETLARARPLRGERLAIMTNGGGPGVMATDCLIEEGGRLAALSEPTLRLLDEVLPQNWSHANPIDLIGDAPAERYLKTLEILSKDPGVDAMLFIHAPTAIVPSAEIASLLASVIKAMPMNILGCWLGGNSVLPARDMFSAAGIPTYDTPEKAVRGFMQMVHYHRNQALLMQVPSSIPGTPADKRQRAREVISNALASQRIMLTEVEAKSVLAAYDIPVVETRVAATVEEAMHAAEAVGFPVVIKILSPQITHKSDVGGVALNLENAQAVRAAATGMINRISSLRPDAVMEGFSVQSMISRPQGRELIVGVATDPVFGPVILFGQGGVAVEVTGDHAIALPPLNSVLAHELICRTRISRLLAGFRNFDPVDIHALCLALVKVSEMLIDIPELVELDINPLVADANGVIALDARIKVQKSSLNGVGRLAIRPYPAELEERIVWDGENVLLRPIRPEDAPQHIEFFHSLEPEDIFNRAFQSIHELQAAQIARLTQIDYDREMAFIASRIKPDGTAETLGVARAIADPDNYAAEFAIIVRSDLKGKGLGHVLLTKLIEYCRAKGTRMLTGETLFHNYRLLDLVRTFGFATESVPGSSRIRLELRLA